MAKRYARLNWNSTTTYVSAENLNKMDKGIDDCDNAIEVLNEGLNTVNNNFINIFVPKSLDWLDQITASGLYNITLNTNNKAHFPSQNQAGDVYNVFAIVNGNNASLFCGQLGYSRFAYNTFQISTKTFGTWRICE